MSVKNTPVIYCSVCQAALALKKGETQAALTIIESMTTVTYKVDHIVIVHAGCAGAEKWYLREKVPKTE